MEYIGIDIDDFAFKVKEWFTDKNAPFILYEYDMMYSKIDNYVSFLLDRYNMKVMKGSYRDHYDRSITVNICVICNAG